MSGSETGVMASMESLNVRHQNSPAPSQPVLQNISMAYGADGTTEYKHLAAITPPTYHSSTAVTGTIINGTDAGQGGGTSGINVNMVSEPLKRKRGRPRKYGPDGAMALVSEPKPLAVSVNQSSGGPASPTSTSLKKVRGRPPGSSKKQQSEVLGSAGLGFTPHVITVKAGEDVSSKIMSFSQHGPRAVCILSANGAISNVTLRQAATSGGTVTYEGRFEILSLSGSFLLSEYGSQRSRTGGLSVSLSGPDGRVLGGGVAGLLTAASPVQVVVGSFIADGGKAPKSANQLKILSAPPKLAPVSGPVGQSSSPSRGTHSESSGGPESPLNPSTGTACNSSKLQGISCMPWK
ncbi:AT-hook motif nuclear-localized protein 10-like [Prosopis cineraria]|uniref:AT-hook motif nuclear-localized protein 10-like n=1 Tax=Prosopis cineraria TaxID=364024 RepID=UPI00240EBD3A|nr:AT-hook motif nuclear-localized protein 10-like [Prosopis cineraria]XP_054794241.1 AT-hook motif nuclear-localized protein 10-like [Prosopis cineraria]XP_054794242.1 AT-hook motif nuclear-localized protein 10-like [Prosopis cineraria]XP_054794243.1 AT-hook motif nuclear-localized protein 10-like [Prosopis cineraria]